MDNNTEKETEKVIQDPQKNAKLKHFAHQLNAFLIKNTPGMRVIKTMIAVFICLGIEAIRQKNRHSLPQQHRRRGLYATHRKIDR